jgi:hypothetical protein
MRGCARRDTLSVKWASANIAEALGGARPSTFQRQCRNQMAQLMLKHDPLEARQKQGGVTTQRP